MPRIPYPELESLTESNRQLLECLPQLHISKMLAGSPCLFEPLTRLFGTYLNEGELHPELREIAILRVAYLLRSEYEMINHVHAARVIGMDKSRVDALLSDDPYNLFNAQEQQVIRFVDEVITAGKASAASFDACAKTMAVAQLIELSVVIGVYTMVAQICATFEIEPEDSPIADTGMGDIQRALQKQLV